MAIVFRLYQNSVVCYYRSQERKSSFSTVTSYKPITIHYKQRNKLRADLSASTFPSPASIEPRRTLIIGDSILKGIKKFGLKRDVDIRTCPGNTLNGIQSQLNKLNYTQYEKIVVYAGGNDAASGSSQKTLYIDAKALLQDIQNKSSSCHIFICTVCPRTDANVVPLNDLLKQLSDEFKAQIIDCHQSFVFGNGTTARNFYFRDGIHLNRSGTSVLIAAIHREIPITRQVAGNSIATDQRRFDSLQGRRMTPKAYCNVCGLNNHDTNDCYRKWRRSYSNHTNLWSESRRYGQYHRQSTAPTEQRAA
ncbi:hypothetical protein DPMN_000603 [Dreissena polymorpha]|uniref:SGNH hydrolase-type esterase domain-containing protein n=1 Tax=Dreissena polymorpha TaxID=45954 RepID=A0A9D4MGZ4_DREPO|nr:hypothetical protein DPMN_000599 [Dreissena polymorpha]KAH3876753.1 hypothetical protein DPMN_000603 [Dreissena polymorpha]